MKMNEREKKRDSAGSLELEPRQHKAIKKEYESVTTGIIKGLFYISLTAVLYFLIFSNAEKVLALLTTKNYTAPAFSMITVVVVAYLLGTGINKLIKVTLERALESQNLREE